MYIIQCSEWFWSVDFSNARLGAVHLRLVLSVSPPSTAQHNLQGPSASSADSSIDQQPCTLHLLERQQAFLVPDKRNMRGACLMFIRAKNISSKHLEFTLYAQWVLYLLMLLEVTVERRAVISADTDWGVRSWPWGLFCSVGKSTFPYLWPNNPMYPSWKYVELKFSSVLCVWEYLCTVLCG